MENLEEDAEPVHMQHREGGKEHCIQRDVPLAPGELFWEDVIIINVVNDLGEDDEPGVEPECDCYDEECGCYIIVLRAEDALDKEAWDVSDVVNERNETADRHLVAKDVPNVQAVRRDVVNKHLLKVVGFGLEEQMGHQAVEMVAPGCERVVVK